jgi:hypothetical protein
VRQALAALVGAAALVPSATSVAATPQPGPWHLVGKPASSRIDAPLHVARTAQGMKALAFVVTSTSSRRINVVWASYCEFQSDDDYTESYSGTLSGVGNITYFPHVFDGATLCDVAVSTRRVKGARVNIAVFAS